MATKKAKTEVAAVSAKTVKAELTGEVAVVAQATMTQNEALPAGYRVKKVLTLPSLVLKTVGAAMAMRFDEPIHTSNVKGKAKPDGSFEDPAQVAQVTNLDTGEQLIFLVPAVVLKNVKELYPNDGYVGKCFFIKNMGKRKESQRYADFGIAEIDLVENSASVVANSAAKK